MRHALRVVFAMLGFCLLGADACEREPGVATDASRFRGIAEWELHFSYEASNEVSYEMDWSTVTETLRESASGVILLTLESNDDGEYLVLRGSAPIDSSIERTRQVVTSTDHDDYRESGSGRPQQEFTVVLELETGRYEVDTGGQSFPTQMNRHIVSTYGEGRDDSWSGADVDDVGPARCAYPDRPSLPAEGLTITGSCSWEGYWAYQAANDPFFDPARLDRELKTSGTTSWTLIPRRPIEVELVVEPVDYEDWMPMGGASETEPGGAIQVVARLQQLGGGEPELRASVIAFELQDVSREPGVSLNHPITAGSDAPDLGFDAAMQPEGIVVLAEGQRAETEPGSHDTATVLVHSYDWGASGVLRVSATLLDGRVVTGRLEGADEDDSGTRLPRRAADSRIADSWKFLVDFSGSDTEDADVQDGNAHDGDGLTAYEEYRGLRARGRHTRQLQGPDGGPLMRPNRKDLVVESHAGAPFRRGLARFVEASGIQIVELTAGELPEDRQVNPQRGALSRGAQHGLRLVSRDLPDGVSGESRPAEVHRKTPRLCELVVVDSAEIATSYRRQREIAAALGMAMPYSEQDDLDNTIAHELAHGIGAPHHGRATEYFDPRVVTAAMTSWHVHGVDGSEVMTRPFTLEGRIGRPGNESSGDASCIMAYTGVYSWAAVGSPGGPYSFYSVGLQPLGTRFCTSAEPTGMNASHLSSSGTTLPGFFGAAGGQGGEAAVGNCLGEMLVSDLDPR